MFSPGISGVKRSTTNVALIHHFYLSQLLECVHLVIKVTTKDNMCCCGPMFIKGHFSVLTINPSKILPSCTFLPVKISNWLTVNILWLTSNYNWKLYFFHVYFLFSLGNTILQGSLLFSKCLL